MVNCFVGLSCCWRLGIEFAQRLFFGAVHWIWPGCLLNRGDQILKVGVVGGIGGYVRGENDCGGEYFLSMGNF